MVEANLILNFISGPFSAMLKLIFQEKNVYHRFFTGFVLIITRLPEKTGVSVTCVGIYEEAYATTTATATKTSLKK